VCSISSACLTDTKMVNQSPARERWILVPSDMPYSANHASTASTLRGSGRTSSTTCSFMRYCPYRSWSGSLISYNWCSSSAKRAWSSPMRSVINSVGGARPRSIQWRGYVMESFSFGTFAFAFRGGFGTASDDWSLPRTNAREMVKKEKSGRIVVDDRVFSTERTEKREVRKENKEERLSLCTWTWAYEWLL
jgi:hypothetical protein